MDWTVISVLLFLAFLVIFWTGQAVSEGKPRTSKNRVVAFWFKASNHWLTAVLFVGYILAMALSLSR